MKRSVTGLGAVSLVGIVFLLGSFPGRAQEKPPPAAQSIGWQTETPGPRLIQFGGILKDRLGNPLTGVLKDHLGKPLTGVQGVSFALSKTSRTAPRCGSRRRT